MLTGNQKLWVEALRSGKYQQGFKTLETESGKFCCLGVLCKVAEEQGIVVYKSQCKAKRIKGGSLVDQPEVQKWVGLKTHFGAYNHGITSLASANDIGITFEQIADIIEKHAGELFCQESC